MKSNPYGIALSAWLEEEIEKIDTVKGVKSLDEVLGRQYALNVLNGLFNFLTREDKNNGKNDYS